LQCPEIVFLGGEMEDKPKVIIVCGNRLLKESIARILRKKNDFEIVATLALCSASWDEIVESGADVLVLDSLEFIPPNAASASRAGAPGSCPKCVLIAMEDDHNRFLTAIRRGARGYVLQDASAADVISAIRAVAEGQAVCPPVYARVLFDLVATQTDEFPNTRRRTRWGLTRREQQLIPLIGRGLSNKEIANHLKVSEQTVRNHIHRMLRKLGVTDRLSVYDACQAQSLRNTEETKYLV
jgi:DNA-binding NarL/FixJ family response regulator